MLRTLAILTALFLAILPAEAKRVALVIGNNAYPNLPEFRQLQKAVNDARAMRDTLHDDLGFDVTFAENADFRAMSTRIKEVEAKVLAGDIVFLYYSGHGVSIGGENFLLPTDIPRPVEGEESRLTGSSFGAEQLIVRMRKRGARAVYTVLDACRDNPFEDETGKAVGGSGGLAKMDASEGVFILFAAGVRETALDRLGPGDTNPNSVFTRSLIPALKQGGLSQVDLAKRVYSEVKTLAASIDHPQHPAYYDQIEGYVALKDGVVAPVVEPQPPPLNDPAREAYAAAGDDPTLLAVVRTNFPGTVWADFAAAKLKTIAEKERKIAVIDVPAKLPEPACESTLLAAFGGDSTCLVVGQSYRDCAGCPEMVVVVPAGSFTMGSPKGEEGHQRNEEPTRTVTIAKPFAVGKFEITRGQFAEFVKDSGFTVGGSCYVLKDGSRSDAAGKNFRDPGFKQTDDHPVVCVSWDDAQAYAKWLSQKTGHAYRLLTESEWEYVARGGNQFRYSFGDDQTKLCEYGNAGDQTASTNADMKKFYETYSLKFNSCNDGETFTAVVGHYAVNGFGLNDMHGNVWEWVQDCYADSYKEAPRDGSATKDSSGCLRVERGGGWFTTSIILRSANRGGSSPDVHSVDLGFRLARTLL